MELTWKKYLTGRNHRCTKCGMRYTTSLNFFHFFEMIVLTTFVAAICIVTGFYVLELEVIEVALSSFIIVSIIVFPIDKNFDNKSAVTKTRKKKESSD